MISFVDTKQMSREEWLAERRNSIGGSEIGAILGINKYESPYSVWAKKKGLISEAEDNEAMRQGRDLEEYVAQRFSEKSGLKVQRKNAIIRNDAFPHMHANIDRKIIGINAGLECKTASALSMKAFKDGEFPESYYAQCVAYMGILEMPRYYLAALILGREFKIYQLTRFEVDECPEWCEASVYVPDEEFKLLRQAAIEFWEDNVVKNVPPRCDGNEATTKAINEIYAESNDATIELVDRNKTIQMLEDTKAQIKELTIQKELVEQMLKSDLGINECGYTDKYIINWKPQIRKTFDHKRFAEEHKDIDLSPYYNVIQTRRFTVKEINND